jgi:hypothetical protein
VPRPHGKMGLPPGAQGPEGSCVIEPSGPAPFPSPVPNAGHQPAAPRPSAGVRSRRRFRNRGTESIRKYGVKWASGRTKRECDQESYH